MRFNDLEKLLRIKRLVVLRTAYMYSIPIATIAFLLLIATSFVGALITGVVVFLIVFGLLYLGRTAVDKGIEKRRHKVGLECVYLDVFFRGEAGALCLLEDSIKFHSLTPGAQHKDFDIVQDEKTFMTVRKIKYSKLQTLKYKDVEQGVIVIKQMPHGVVYMFSFYDYDNLIEKVAHRVEEVSKYSEGENGETEEKNT